MRQSSNNTEEGVVSTEREVSTAKAMRVISNEIARLGARMDQLSAARRDAAWKRVANIPNDPKESSTS
jgi:hypothetical protein